MGWHTGSMAAESKLCLHAEDRVLEVPLGDSDSLMVGAYVVSARFRRTV